MSALEELTEIATNLESQALKAWKAEGKKVVGYLCSYIPEEILYAADILPYRVRASGCTDTGTADVYFSSLNCSFSRSCLQFLLDGHYDFLDGVAFTNSCDHTRRIIDIVREAEPTKFPFLHLISCPRKITEESIGMFKKGITAFKKEIEDCFNVEITDEKLEDAIEVYNESRRLLKKLYELRKSDNPPLTGRENLNVILASSVIPKDQFNTLLKQLLAELNERKGISNYKARFLITGSGGCDSPDYYDLIEDLGGLVVTDTLCIGSRTFWHPVEIEDDLLGSIARAYLKRPSCPLMVDGVVERSRFIKEMCESFNVDGVIYHTMRYCDLWGGSVFDIRKNLKNSDIPILELEREYMFGGAGQLRTRVQAFLERIGG